MLAMDADITAWLRGVDYFARLPDDDFLEVVKHLHLRRYSAGQVILLEGDPCDGLFIVREGRVRVYKMSPAGKEQVLRIIQPGESFNDVPVFDGGPNPASADCVDESEVGTLTTAGAEELLRTRPGFIAAMLRVFARRLRQLTVVIEDFAFHSVRARLARASLQTAENGATHLTQRDLAEMAGTAREVAGRELREIERQGVIHIGRGLTTLLDAGRLERIAAGG
jgi:CRP/FNR family transcriptional regulator